ncbi:DUF4278 domain-containing protein [Oxynema aestuarii]|jgi:hypothetical protein|uniref:DUF4278 domain-containing protein n=1 Tax=Oxynema aestuarii AP17 TaxID=2064643 RepID=A0A6H1U4F4_9CYAN|nr:DUF4278 domain-containing protein [Oxynema aestuarii]QIZ72913.1 DUF4278 domain-containing protein [Oxynema aestuarii AP17]RMH78643.1 MAG: DUF4278 domain-containing protein [Cyanobacteria bacterium J007]
MQLTYRGITYEYTPPTVEETEGTLSGRYRGLDWQFCNVQKQPVQQTNVELKYRGVSYNPAETVAVNAPEEKARYRMMKRDRRVQKRQRSMLSRLAGEVGLGLAF